jgi:hypothetical protein
MALIDLSISLTCKPFIHREVRMFVDVSPGEGLGRECEVALVRGTEGWSGAFEVPDDHSDLILFRLGLCAEEGGLWSLRMAHRELGHEILFDGDQLALAKCWIVGTCSLAVARKLPCPSSAPSLRLVPAVGEAQDPPQRDGNSEPTVPGAFRRPQLALVRYPVPMAKAE